MTAVATDAVEHLDFEGVIPCESIKTKCDEPAMWIGRATCPSCGGVPTPVATQTGCDFHYKHRERGGEFVTWCCLMLVERDAMWKFERLS